MGRNHIDEIDRQIIRLLQENARTSIATIGKRITMSAPSVKERIVKLEEKGIIKGYHVSLNMDELDRGMTTFLLFKTEHCREFEAICKRSKWVTDLHRISGEYNFLLTIQTNSMVELNLLQESLMKFGVSKSFISTEKLFSNCIDV
ncbi:Lrp/AsnC family transcriptional regulator [Shimazuella kribbensis]|uniref:Lrp/AsnC family transcriptional regulator n=1 Tax=Shimazuella kribbensis TaxID=139808 RepID=UPI0004231E5F|nr:Lrp/AsnC family transcriptional regulator [Shimazuella kribbensis]